MDYESVGWFSDVDIGFMLMKNEKKGVVNQNGEFMVPIYYDLIEYRNPYAVASNTASEEDVYVLKTGKKLNLQGGKLAEIGFNHEAMVYNNNKLAVFTVDGKELKHLALDEAGLCCNKYYVGAKNQKLGVYDRNWKLLIPHDYEANHLFVNEKCVVVKKGEKWGALDFHNKVIIPFVYESQDKVPQ